jgi:predicted RNase H-like nuclease (RuvC/YqgF family)
MYKDKNIMNLDFQISLAASMFIKHLKQLQVSTLERMSTPPFREHAREQYLRHLWHHNEQVKAEISALSAKMQEQNKNLKLKLMAKTLLIKQHEAKIERLNKKCEEDIKKTV